jgi:streptomycin 3"-adenylyltransferase
MTIPYPAEIAAQLRAARTVLDRHLTTTLQAIHLFGSALDGGLKPHSDIDLLVTVSIAPDESTRCALLLDLLTVSVEENTSGSWRPLEVTVVARDQVIPWRYPARRELQFGEWLREDLLAGVFEPPLIDRDLAILLTKTRQHSVALVGQPASIFFEPVPLDDFSQALSDTITLWNSEPDWKGEERNVILTLARIWYSAATGRIAPKDVAAAWVLQHLPAEHRPVLSEALKAYLGTGSENWPARAQQTAAFILCAKSAITDILPA